MSAMAVASGGVRSTLNPNAPLFIPAAYQQVDDFSPEWWELVKTTSWFRDHWFREHQEQETFDGEEDEDVANLLPDSFDLGITDDFSSLGSLDEAAFHAAFDIVEQEPFYAGGGQKQEGLKNGVNDTEALIKSLSLRSPKNGTAKTAVEPLKYHEKPMQYVSPKFSPRRIGQHILAALSRADGSHSPPPHDVAFTHHCPIPPQNLVDAVAPAIPFRVDLPTGEGFDSISAAFGQPDVIVNCAAISVPRACEVDPEAAMAINVPSALVNWVLSVGNGDSLLIHLSTDQVYQGVKSFYKEEDEPNPVNMYGKSKVAAEQFISEKCTNFAILRSSIMYGPQTISHVTKSLPIQWIDGVLARGEEVEFFHDEYRCPVYVKDVVDVIFALIKKRISDGGQMKLLLNVGGPDRESRAQMAETVADVRGYNHALIKSVSASSVNRGVVSPADISMDISRLIEVLGVTPISFKDGVRLTLKDAVIS